MTSGGSTQYYTRENGGNVISLRSYDTATGLTKFGARYYNPDLGRFTQRDPSGEDLPYAYAGCDPVNHTDWTGLYSWDDFYADVGLVASVRESAALSAAPSAVLSGRPQGEWGQFRELRLGVPCSG
jgi:RHS repeat-associated protein